MPETNTNANTEFTLRPRWQQLRTGSFLIKKVVSSMDKVTLYHLQDYEDQDLSTLPDRVVTEAEFVGLLT